VKINDHQHLAYCTNIHPAESWAETFYVLKTEVLAVRDSLKGKSRLEKDAPYAIGLRLSARAARELLSGSELDRFKDWLSETNTYIFTINGFPYGDFHGTRVKEKVYQPDWTTDERLAYTQQLFQIIATLCPASSGGSVSSLPLSFKEFQADEELAFIKLYRCLSYIEELAEQSGKDLHLGLEPEPLGHFENTEETIQFFAKFYDWRSKKKLRHEIVEQHLGVNYDTCHFALEYENPATDFATFTEFGIRLSKIHLSNALSFNPQNEAALETILSFNEPTYLHQVITKDGQGKLTRYKDLPDYLETIRKNDFYSTQIEGRIHFHIPLYQSPLEPISSTLPHAQDTIKLLKETPSLCPHLEIETYTWGVLPKNLQTPLTQQISNEYQWVIDQLG